jgi:hypothetical protein
VVEDFTLGGGSGGSGGSGTTQTVPPGGTATYSIPLGPTGGSTTFPVPITLSLTGNPPGSKVTWTPGVTIPADTPPIVGLVIQTVPSNLNARLNPQSAPGPQLPPFLWSLLLLPFAGKLRRAGKKLGKTVSLLMLLGAGIAATIGMNGCGATNGFFAQQQKTYTMTITATAGNLSHSTNVTLIVE